MILETEESIFTKFKILFSTFEVLSIAVFTIEYLLRLWVCTEEPKYHSPVICRLRYALAPLSLVDLFSFLPFYLPFTNLDLRFLRALRLFRLFRIFKIGRYSQSVTLLVRVLRSKKEELVITLFSGLILLIIASSLVFVAEHDAQPDVFSSIPASMWWGAVTLTTVGYGDIYPKTILGKFLGAFIAILGIGLFALPAGIIASGFSSELQKPSTAPTICPHCGNNIKSIPDDE